jgi:hypothetical protein
MHVTRIFISEFEKPRRRTPVSPVVDMGESFFIAILSTREVDSGSILVRRGALRSRQRSLRFIAVSYEDTL